MDRRFQASNVLHPLRQGGANRHFLVCTRSDTTGRVVTRTAHTDELVEFAICAATRRKEPTLPLHWRVRRIRYRIKGGKEQMLLTSLLYPTNYPAKETLRSPLPQSSEAKLQSVSFKPQRETDPGLLSEWHCV